MPASCYYMNDLIHATPVHPSLCLQYFNPAIYYNRCYCCFILLLLLLHYCHCYKTVATDKPLRASLLSGAAELTTHLSRFINILWLPLCRINKFGFYFPRRLLRSPILVGHQRPPRKHSCILFLRRHRRGGDSNHVGHMLQAKALLLDHRHVDADHDARRWSPRRRGRADLALASSSEKKTGL